MSKGQLLKRFIYEPIPVLHHFKHILGIECLMVFSIIGGVFRGAPIDWMMIVLGFFLYLRIDWCFRLKKENRFSTFSCYEQGIEIHIHQPEYKKKTVWYTWEHLTNVELVSPFDRVPPGLALLSFWQGRPGFELEFDDGFKVMAYQRISGYAEFYQMLKDKGAPNIQSKLPIYDRLSVHGQSLDGKKSEFFNNGGKPAAYVDID